MKRTLMYLGHVATSCILAFSIRASAADPGGSCKITQAGPKCGTDQVLSHGMCGSTNCNYAEVVYDVQYFCVNSSTGGATSCSSTKCYKRTYARECHIENGLFQCKLMTQNAEEVTDSHVAFGQVCSPNE